MRIHASIPNIHLHLFLISHMSLKYRHGGQLSACKIFQIVYSPAPKSNMKAFWQTKQSIVTFTTKGKIHLRYCIRCQILYCKYKNTCTHIDLDLCDVLIYTRHTRQHKITQCKKWSIDDFNCSEKKYDRLCSSCWTDHTDHSLLTFMWKSKLDVSYSFILSQRLSALSGLINHLLFASTAHIHAVYSPQ